MFLLNTIIAWGINIIMNKKYDNNNIIIASRAYSLQEARRVRRPVYISPEQRILAGAMSRHGIPVRAVAEHGRQRWQRTGVGFLRQRR
jgi:hypothetical protein